MAEMIPDDVMEMLPEFLQESDEHLQVLNEKMLVAEAAIKGGEAMSPDDLNTMFRSAHTIKGTASFIGLKKVVGLTHKAETLLQKLRDAELLLNAQIVDVLFSAFDTLVNLLKSLKENKTEDVDIDVDVQKIEKILNPGGGVVPVAVSVVAPAVVSKPAPVVAPVVPPVVSIPTPLKPSSSQVSSGAVKDGEHSSVDEEGISERYLEQFVSEIEQNIDTLNAAFLKAEKELDDIEIVNEVFRTMHTIKGSAGLVNAKPIAEVAHKMENILEYFRSQKKPLPVTLLAIFFRGVDAFKEMIDSLKLTRKINYNIVPICKELDKCSIKVVLEMKVAATKTSPVAAVAAVVVKPPVVKVQEVNVDWANLPEAVRSVVKSERGQGKDVFIVEGVIVAREAIKSMRLAMIEERLNKSGRVAGSFPSVEVLDTVKADAMIQVLFCSNINETNIREILMMDGVTIKTVEMADAELIQTIMGDKVMEKEHPPEVNVVPEIKQTSAVPSPVVKDEHKPQASAAVNTPVEISTVKIDARKLDKLMNLSGELVIIRSQYARLVGLFSNDMTRQKDVVRITEHTALLVSELEKEFISAVASTGKDAGRLQKMIEELKASIQTLCVQSDREEFTANFHILSETTSALEKTASDLQASVMQTRMVPVEGVFTRFKRIVRDISKDLNKEVNLKIEGAETELDKKIVDGLGDPLTHMIRNAVDHGLESAEDRAKTNKNPVGTILLRASHKGNSMCIQISDDGKGMDADKIAGIAVKKGVITEEQSQRMTEKEKLNLIFLPGFSTAQKVTGLSGRGVGMDVVRSMIASFNGVVDINTKLGEGSSFILKIPLTLAIIQALLVVIGGEVYALPLDAVTEIIKVPKKDIYYVDGNATVKLRNHALSLIELEKVIKVKPNKDTDEDHKRLVIITDGENRLGVQVDSLVGKDEIVIKSFTKHFARVKGVIGASILADGNVALILDPATIIKESR